MADENRTMMEELQNWWSRLERQYIRETHQVALYEEEHQLASSNDTYDHLDRLERDIERADYAIKLCGRHDIL